MKFSPRIIVNSLEAFQRRGSGISLFAKTLLASPGPNAHPDILIDTKTDIPCRILQESSLFQVHKAQRKDTRINKIRNAVFSANHFLRKSITLKTVPENDRLFALALKKLGLEPSCDSVPVRSQVQIYGGKHLQRKSHLHYSTTRKLTPLRLRLPITEKDNIVFHNPSPSPIFINGAKNILTIHDFIAITHPELCLSNPSYEYDLVSSLINKYDHIHFISDYTANTAYSIFGETLRQKSSIITQPISRHPQHFEISTESCIRQRRELLNSFRRSGAGYIIQVGTLEPKKNHMTALEAFLILRNQHPHLRFLIVGKEGWLCEEVVSRIKDLSSYGVEWLNYTSREMLVHLLSKALAFVFPSVVEGWGLPPIEAMALGTPALVSNIPACQQACKEAAIYIDSYLDPFSWAKEIGKLLEIESYYLDRAIKGVELGRLQSHDEYQIQLARMYRKVLGG